VRPSTAPLELAIFAGEEVRVVPLPARGSVALGRAEGNDVRVDHPSVSRRHAILHLGPPLRLEDLGGKNGTFVRDPRAEEEDGRTLPVVQVSRETVPVRVGDCITLGSAALAVRLAPAGAPDRDGEVVSADPAMRALLDQARRAANSLISVLILGETGVGKEVLAHTIHRCSPRARGPFLALNCAALSESLLESELFGHEKGSFTGAVAARPGLFEAAEGGTVFLDEAGELPMSIQVKLLRVLEERKVLRVGARVPRAVDVRFVSATNRDLDAEIARGAFRQDLFFRLNGIALTIPPLRQRVSEVAPLAEVFAAEPCRQLDRRRPPALSTEALSLLQRYPWPGNIRELRNAVERAVVLCQGDTLLPEHFPAKMTGRGAPPPPPPPAVVDTAPLPGVAKKGDSVERLTLELGEVERRRVVRALELCQGNQTKAAAMLGVSRTTLVARIKLYGLPRPRKKRPS
jgi:two-component system, NtrC family, response regulator AtoC